MGDSIVGGLARYNNVWKNLFGNGFINLGIRGDRVELVLWHVRDTAFPPWWKHVVIRCGTNNKDLIILFKDWLPLVHPVKTDSITLTFICGLPSRECFFINSHYWWNKQSSQFQRFRKSHFVDQINGWTLNNGTLDFSLFYSDDLHLVEKCNLELTVTINFHLFAEFSEIKINNENSFIINVIINEESLFWKRLIPLSLAQKFETATKMQFALQISIWI